MKLKYGEEFVIGGVVDEDAGAVWAGYCEALFVISRLPLRTSVVSE